MPSVRGTRLCGGRARRTGPADGQTEALVQRPGCLRRSGRGGGVPTRDPLVATVAACAVFAGASSGTYSTTASTARLLRLHRHGGSRPRRPSRRPHRLRSVPRRLLGGAVRPGRVRHLSGSGSYHSDPQRRRRRSPTAPGATGARATLVARRSAGQRCRGVGSVRDDRVPTPAEGSGCGR
jgi:hypothetical protein